MGRDTRNGMTCTTAPLPARRRIPHPCILITLCPWLFAACGGSGPTSASAPDTTLSAPPSGIVNAATAVTFDLGCDGGDCTFECSRDGASFDPCSSPTTLTGLGDGSHTFAARATRDGLTDPTPASASFVVDALAPTASITPPGSVLGAGLLTFAFACDEAACAYECALDGEAFTPCAARADFDLSPGDHTLRVRATDAAGNPQNDATSFSASVELGFREVAVGTSTCAIASSGSLYCWGRDEYGELGNGAGTTENQTLPQRIGTRTDWEHVASNGRQVMCASTRAGELYCWGNLEYLGGATLTDAPALIVSGRHVRSVGVGARHLCVLDDAGLVACLGDASNGQTGTGSTAFVGALTDVDTNRYTALTVGGQHTCAVREGGRLFCWGLASNVGIAALADDVLEPTAVDANTDWTAIDAGYGHVCGLRSGALYCWGYVYGLDPAYTDAPREVGALDDALVVWSGSGGSCVRSEGGVVSCIGSGSFGDTEPATDAPREVSVQRAARALADGVMTCAIDAANTLACWTVLGESRSNIFLGNGESYARATPTYADDGWTDVVVSSGGYHACGIKTDGTLWCWGYNDRGALGLGDEELRTAPTRVGERDDWSVVSAGRSRTCAIADGDLYCWGDNQSGRLGVTNAPARVLEPALVDGARSWTDVSVAPETTCAVADGELYCWGSNYGGMLGVGDTAPRATPTRVGTETRWQSVSIAEQRACGTLADGSGGLELWCWGYNGVTVTDPARMGSASDWSVVAAGGGQDCALNDAGQLYCVERASMGPVPDFTLASADTGFSFVAEPNWGSGCAARAGRLYCWGADEAVFDATGPVPTTAPLEVPMAGVPASVSLGPRTYCALDSTGGRHCWGDGPTLGLGLEWRTPQRIATPVE